MPSPATRTRPAALGLWSFALCVALAVLLALTLAFRSVHADTPAAPPTRGGATSGITYGFSWADGLALGVVEGITEYLPVSSTGHLVVVEHLLDLDPPDGPAKDALNSYTVVIQ